MFRGKIKEVELRCKRCGWHLVSVEIADTSAYDFCIKKTCPHCKERNEIKVLKFKTDTSSLSGTLG